MSQSKSEKLYELLEKFFGGTKDESEPVAEVTKSIDIEERRALFVVLEPETVDLHGFPRSSLIKIKTCGCCKRWNVIRNWFRYFCNNP